MSSASTTASTNAVYFTDWDGTVTLQDSNDYMVDHYGYGRDARRVVNDDMLDGKVTFRDGFHDMLISISDNGHTLEEGIELLLKNVKLDPGFKGFFLWCKSNGIPLYIISSGMKPVITALISKLIGQDAADYCQIISNDVYIDPKDPTKWHIVYRDDSSFGHNKAASIAKIMEGYKGTPTKFFSGDGVSDLSASSCCDLLFARNGLSLVTYCQRNKLPYRGYDSFDDIKKDVAAVFSGEKTIADIYAEEA